MDVSLRQQPISHRRLGGFLGVARRRQSYLNLLYLLVMFPVGLLYFIVLTVGITTGISLAIVGVGVPILWLMLRTSWGLGSFERELAIWWLGSEMTPRPRWRHLGRNGWQRLRASLRSRLTWTGLLYLLVQLPFGLCAFGVIVPLIALTSALISAPIVALVDLAVNGAPGPSELGLLAGSPLVALLGIVVGLLSLHACNGMVWVWGQFARATLGISAAEQQLASARAAASQAQTQAARAEQSRRELIVNVSHELRTPIASIRGHVESLLMASEGETPSGEADDTVAPAELHEYLIIIDRESERLSALAEDLLMLARAEARELHLDLRPTPVGAVVEEVRTALAPLARRERHVTLVTDVPAGLPLVLADRQRLAQVLLNLTRNAITYTPAGGLVSLSAARADADHLMLTVADTGVGITPEEQERIFERFYRVDASRARASGGSGLGLTIVRDLVEAMGGTVSVESVVGEGSRFHVVLRIVTAPAATS